MVDLRRLAGFFEEEVEQSLTALTHRHPEHLKAGGPLDASLRAGLMAACFDLTHRTLVAQYKLIEDQVAFDAYCDALKTAELRTRLHARYPVLHRWVRTLIENWLYQTSRLLTRLSTDSEIIGPLYFEGASPPALLDVQMTAGDAHHRGAAVAVLRFDGGRRLVYKPRSLALDTGFASLVVWLNEITGLDLATPVHLERPDYGWVEFVVEANCSTPDDVASFYRRIGGFLCVFYLLEASDFHYENLVANGSHPVMVDMETLFHPRASWMTPEDSVLKTGLLPTGFMLDGSRALQLSGLSDVQDHPGLIARNMLRMDEGGGLAFARDRGRLAGKQNIPRLDGMRVGMDESLRDAVRKGFETTYQAILARHAVFEDRIRQFADTQVRVVLRNTVAYSHLLDEALHPALLISETAVAAHFRFLGGKADDDKLVQVRDQEIASLQGRDIPLFWTKAGSRDLSFDGGTIDGFFVQSGLEKAIQNVRRMSLDDMARQSWIITRVLDEPKLRPPCIVPTSFDGGTRKLALRDRLLKYAEDVGRELVRRLSVDGSRASWLVSRAASLDGRQQQISTPLFDLHTGLPGEILFFDALSTTADDEWAVLAREAGNELLDLLEREHVFPAAAGLYTGWGGVLYLHACLVARGRFPELASELSRLIDQVDFQRLIDRDTSYSLLSGSAGLMWALAEHDITVGSPELGGVAQTAARHLLDRRSGLGAGASWRISSATPLSGLAHGASGFAAAFAKLYQARPEPQYREACLAALDYERSLYMPDQRNWRDCRDVVDRTGGPPCALSWAHGAPGVGISRLALIEAGIDDPLIREDLDIAMQTTLAPGVGLGSSLVAGVFGVLELPIRYAETVDDRYWPQTVILLESALNQLEIERDRFGESPPPHFGLMVGETGHAYQCLRIARNTTMGSVLGLRSRSASHGLDIDI